MQTLNHSYVMGLIEFKSNHIDQSPAFLRTVLATLLNEQNLRFSIANTPIWEIDYDTEYYFEDFVEDQLSAIITRPFLFDNLLTYNPSLKKIHPKSQFDQLKINVTYREINEYAQFVQTGHIALELDYDNETDRIHTIVHKNNKTVHTYNAVNIKNKMQMDAIDTFTEDGVFALLWQIKFYMHGWRFSDEDFPTLSRVVAHHETLDDPTAFYLNVFKEAGLDNVVRTDVQAYIENELEDHLEASPTVRALLKQLSN